MHTAGRGVKMGKDVLKRPQKEQDEARTAKKKRRESPAAAGSRADAIAKYSLLPLPERVSSPFAQDEATWARYLARRRETDRWLSIKQVRESQAQSCEDSDGEDLGPQILEEKIKLVERVTKLIASEVKDSEVAERLTENLRFSMDIGYCGGNNRTMTVAMASPFAQPSYLDLEMIFSERCVVWHDMEFSVHYTLAGGGGPRLLCSNTYYNNRQERIDTSGLTSDFVRRARQALFGGDGREQATISDLALLDLCCEATGTDTVCCGYTWPRLDEAKVVERMRADGMLGKVLEEWGVEEGDEGYEYNPPWTTTWLRFECRRLACAPKLSDRYYEPYSHQNARMYFGAGGEDDYSDDFDDDDDEDDDDDDEQSEDSYQSSGDDEGLKEDYHHHD